MKTKTTRKQINNRLRPIFNNEHEQTTFLCAGLAELGWSTKAIAAECGLSEGQVIYRLGLIGIERSKYRNGESNTSQRVLDVCLSIATNEARPKMEKVKHTKKPRY